MQRKCVTCLCPLLFSTAFKLLGRHRCKTDIGSQAWVQQHDTPMVCTHTVAGVCTACDRAAGLGNHKCGAQGDCGLMHVRQDKILFQTQAMNHRLDIPLQLAAVPEHARATDHASNAFLAQLPLKGGDVLVAGSDGLWVSVQHVCL